MPRKRVREEMEEALEPVAAPPTISSTLLQIRSMWEFAALNQYLFTFGKAVKLDDVDMEDFEDECLKPGPSEKLSHMGLALLKQVSSHKGLTPEIFDEYTRRQFVAKAPKRNPFGTDEDPLKFAEFDIFTKIRILHQLSVWTLNNPNPIREKMDATENDQMAWRVEPFGWDADERTYFLLDDNRLYRRTDAPPPPDEAPKTPKSKAKAKKGGRNTRSNKRRRVSRTIPETSPEEEDDEPTEEKANGVNGEEELHEPRMDDFCQKEWELIAVSMDDYTNFIDTIRKSKDPNERILKKQIEQNVFPVLLEQEEERKRKEARRLKELENLQKLATAKRSSRLAVKMDKINEQKAAEEAERKRLADLEMARKEMLRAEQMEHARASRVETREQRLREREAKRILEEERLQREEELLKQLEAEGKDADAERARISERKLKADMQKRKKDLENLQQEDDSWYFDCSVCGVHGQNLDDGSHSMACDKCNVWQHSACHGVSKEQAEREEFHFLCQDCENKAKNPVPPLKLNFSSSPPQQHSVPQAQPSGTGYQKQPSAVPGASRSPLLNGPSLSPQGQTSGPPGSRPLFYPGPPRPPPQAPMKNGTGSIPVGPQPHPLYPPQPSHSHSQSPPQLPQPRPLQHDYTHSHSQSPPQPHSRPLQAPIAYTLPQPPTNGHVPARNDAANRVPHVYPQYGSPQSQARMGNGYHNQHPQPQPARSILNPAPQQNGAYNGYRPAPPAGIPVAAPPAAPARAPAPVSGPSAAYSPPRPVPVSGTPLYAPHAPPQAPYAPQAPQPPQVHQAPQPPQTLNPAGYTPNNYTPATPAPSLRAPPTTFTPNAQQGAHGGSQGMSPGVGSPYGSSPGYSPVKKASPQVPQGPVPALVAPVVGPNLSAAAPAPASAPAPAPVTAPSIATVTAPVSGGVNAGGESEGKGTSS